MERTHGTTMNFLDPHETGDGRNNGGTGYDARSIRTTLTFDNVLNYKHTWGKHTLDAMLGSSGTTDKSSNNWINGSYYASSDIKTLNAANKISWDGTGSWEGHWAMQSYFARLNYNFRDTYLFTANFRADGTSKLAPGHRWGYFPSFSAAWRISSEPFMRNVTWINDLKLRGGWGQTGNQMVRRRRKANSNTRSFSNFSIFARIDMGDNYADRYWYRLHAAAQPSYHLCRLLL